MKERTNRALSERDLRTLTTDDLLALIQDDIRSLDSLISSKGGKEEDRSGEKKRSTRRPAKASTGNRPVRPPQMTLDEMTEPAEPAVERLPLHTVSCCNSTMGDFPASAQVRCPFCGAWHRAGNFPAAG